MEWEACGVRSSPHGAFAEQTGGVSPVFFFFSSLILHIWWESYGRFSGGLSVLADVLR